MRFVVRLSGRIIVRDSEYSTVLDASAVIEQHLDDVMDQLLELDAQDPSIELSHDLVEFSVLVTASNPLLATEDAGTILRTAIHAANGGTPDWPKADDHHAWSVSLVGLTTESVGSDLPAFA